MLLISLLLVWILGQGFYLPVMNKYGDYKIYYPNQDTFESEEIAIIDTPRREAQTRML